MLTKIADLEDPDARELLWNVTVVSRLDAFLEEKNTPRLPRRGTFTASDLGSWDGNSFCGDYKVGCARKLWYRHRGEVEQRSNIAPTLRRRLDLGTAGHEMLDGYFEKIAEESGGSEEFVPEHQINPEDGTSEVAWEWGIIVRVDGVYSIHLSDPVHIRFCLEFKTETEQNFQKVLKKPKPEHVTQLMVGMACWDLPAGVLVYINLNSGAMVEHRVLFDQNHWNAVTEKMRYVRKYSINNIEPNREDGFHCKYCKYKWVCAPPSKKKRKVHTIRMPGGG